MCEFCHQHGEGKKWYLNAKNYSQDLLSDVKRQARIKGLFSPPSGDKPVIEQIDQLDRLPGFVRRMVSWRAVRHSKKTHYGQVLPLEDVEEVFGFVSKISRIACICRYLTTGKEARFCYGVALDPADRRLQELVGFPEGFDGGPFDPDTEVVTKEEAVEAFRDHERHGACHTVWTFGTPFIGGICNCDRSSECLAMYATVNKKLPMMFRAEYVAQVDPGKCSGCRACMRVCPFGAVGYSLSQEKATIFSDQCYGCGICRASCAKDAIELKDRESVPAAAGVW